MDNEIAIKVQGVSKDFVLPHKKRGSLKSFFLSPFSKYEKQKQHALNNVSFEIEKGDFFGIVGKNGSGKSTLLKCIAGVYTPNKGDIEINGSLVPFIELGVGFDPELSGRDNVYLNGALLGFNRDETEKLYEDIVEFAELEEFMDQKLKNYSSGMQVRLAFSIAIRARSDILLLDEVLAVGDSSFKRKCNRYFEDIKNSGTTVVLVTHDMGAVQQFCNKAILIESGKITKAGSPQDVADEYRSINMNSIEKGAPKINKLPETVTIEILDQTKEKVKFKISHQEKKPGDYYFGLSVTKDGITFAEISSLNFKSAKIVNKSLTYELDISDYNPGVYEISGALLNAKTKEPASGIKSRPQFIIRGYDESRSGPIRLKDSWGQ